jgi:hypothetical protein
MALLLAIYSIKAATWKLGLATEFLLILWKFWIQGIAKVFMQATVSAS